MRVCARVRPRGRQAGLVFRGSFLPLGVASQANFSDPKPTSSSHPSPVIPLSYRCFQHLVTDKAKEAHLLGMRTGRKWWKGHYVHFLLLL